MANWVDVWRIPLVAHGDTESLAAPLDDRERTRMKRLASPTLRRRYALAHVGLREILAMYLRLDTESVEIGARACTACGRPHGKPVVAGAQFSLTHDGGLALVAVSPVVEVGIDLERASCEVALRTSSSWMAPVERRRLDELGAHACVRAASVCWVRKEAYLKGCGDGLNPPLSSVDVSGCEPVRLDANDGGAGSRGWRLHDIAVGRGWVAALAVHGPKVAIAVRDWLPAAKRLDPGRRGV